jgi:hypothetical protein
VVQIRGWREIYVPASDNGVFANVAAILYGKNNDKLQKMTDKVAKFMANNKKYYFEMIGRENDHP